MVILFITFERLKRWRYNTFLFVFWFMLFMASIIILRSKIMHHINKNSESISLPANISTLDLVLYYINFGLISTSLVLAGISERVESKSLAPEEKISVLSHIMFWWSNNLIKTGYKRDLKKEDLFEISNENRSETLTKKFEKEWNKKAVEYMRKAEMNQKQTKNEKNVIYKTKLNETTEEEGIKLVTTINNEDAANVEIKTKTKKNSKSKLDWFKQSDEPSLGLCISKIFIYKFIGIAALKLTHDLLNFVRPIVLDKLISFVKDKEQKIYVGFFYIFILCISSIAQTLMIQHYYHQGMLKKNFSLAFLIKLLI